MMANMKNPKIVRCDVCSVDIEVSEQSFPHFIFRDSVPDNILFACASCNRSVGGREIEFKSYLASLMQASGEYGDVRLDTRIGRTTRYRADISATEQASAEPLIIETKGLTSLSDDRINSATAQLKTYGKAASIKRLVLALPGKISIRLRREVRQSGIELWDAPEIHRRFSNQIAANPNPSFPILLSPNTHLTAHEKLAVTIEQCEPGQRDWVLYQQAIGQLIELCFCPPLSPPIGELPDKHKTNRRDFIVPNRAESGFWRFVQRRYAGDYIVVDAKNSGKPIPKKDVLQISNYLKPYGTGQFAIIFSRKGADDGAKQTLREIWRDNQKMIVVLDDTNAESILIDASAGGEGTQPVEDSIRKFRLSM